MLPKWSAQVFFLQVGNFLGLNKIISSSICNGFCYWYFFLILVVYIVSLPCANFYVHSCCISGVLLICTCVFGYFQVHQVSLLKKIITSVFQKLFSSNNFFLALKSIYFHPRTSLNPPPLGFCVSGVAKLIIEKATPASLGIAGVATMYVRVNRGKVGPEKHLLNRLGTYFIYVN